MTLPESSRKLTKSDFINLGLKFQLTEKQISNAFNRFVKEVGELHSIISKGSHTAHAFKVAYILLNCDEGEFSDKSTGEQICKILKVSPRTIDRVKKRFVEEGFDAVLERCPTTREYEGKIDGDVEARLIALSCSEPPPGFARWSLRMLADKMVELNYIDSISHVSVWEVLKKTNLSRGK